MVNLLTRLSMKISRRRRAFEESSPSPIPTFSRMRLIGRKTRDSKTEEQGPGSSFPIQVLDPPDDASWRVGTLTVRTNLRFATVHDLLFNPIAAANSVEFQSDKPPGPNFLYFFMVNPGNILTCGAPSELERWNESEMRSKHEGSKSLCNLDTFNQSDDNLSGIRTFLNQGFLLGEGAL